MWHHKNTYKKEGWNGKWERKPLKKRWMIPPFWTYFMTSHMTHDKISLKWLCRLDYSFNCIYIICGLLMVNTFPHFLVAVVYKVGALNFTLWPKILWLRKNFLLYTDEYINPRMLHICWYIKFDGIYTRLTDLNTDILLI